MFQDNMECIGSADAQRLAAGLLLYSKSCFERAFKNYKT